MVLTKQNKTSIAVRFLFFLFFYLYLFVFTNPSISYFVQQPVFLFDKTCLLKYLNHPGGISEYLSRFLSQFYYFPWPGTLIITLAAWAITFVTGRILKSLGLIRYTLVLQLLPAIALIYLNRNYEFKLINSLVPLLSLSALYLYLRLSGLKFIPKIAFQLLSSAVLYYIAGGGGLLLYASMCIIKEIIGIKDYKSLVSATLPLIIFIIIPWLSARFLFYITLKQAYLHLLSPGRGYEPSLMLYCLFISFPLLVAVAGVVPAKESPFGTEMIIQYIAIIVLIASTIAVPSSPDQKLENRVRYLAYKERWEELLKLAKHKYSNNRIVNFHTNRALFHTGRLAYDMFEYPQNRGKYGLLMEGTLDVNYLMDNSDLFFDMGHIGSAQHWAYEAQTKYENSPRILKRLVLTNIINGDFGAANSMLMILRKSILYRKWTDHYLECIHNPDKLKEDTLIQSKRKIKPSVDFFIDDIFSYNKDLIFILEENLHNRMAYEYLMAYYILDKDLNNFIRYLQYLDELGYKEIPKNYEEALLFYLSRRDAKRISLGKYRFNENILSRYKDYVSIIMKNKGDIEAAKKELQKYHGNTCWFYLHFINPFMGTDEPKKPSMYEFK